jgi:hypothetical protein
MVTISTGLRTARIRALIARPFLAGGLPDFAWAALQLVRWWLVGLVHEPVVHDARVRHRGVRAENHLPGVDLLPLSGPRLADQAGPHAPRSAGRSPFDASRGLAATPRPAPASAPATSPGPASLRSTPARKTRTATRRPRVRWSAADPMPPPRPPSLNVATIAVAHERKEHPFPGSGSRVPCQANS